MNFQPWLGSAIVLAAFAALLCVARECQRRFAPPPEVMRKLMHIGMGLTMLILPWVFTSAWPVLALGVVIAALLVAIKYYPPLQPFGAVIGSVERTSRGDLYFVAAVVALFGLSAGDPILFSIPMLLTLADAGSALVGARYGLWHYRTPDGRKSAEGSVSFFVIAFMCALIPLLLWTTVPRAETLFIALTLALLATLMEGIAWRGLDNLFVPLGSWGLLKIYLGLSASALAGRFAVTSALIALALTVRARVKGGDPALIAVTLAGYGCWARLGWPWLVGLLLLFFGLTLKPRPARPALTGRK